MSKIYYLHNDRFNTEAVTPSKVINQAREEFRLNGTKSFIYFIDREKFEVGCVGWQFKLKDTSNGKIFKNIYIDYFNALQDAEQLEQRYKHNFDIINEYGERW